ncbi:recombinase family protein [Halobacillus sp. Nhm2S1]|uniref:recombinase family protein n=1 Tax=Halobacillus sp. Nhm2S1 TaxID=2866716 RepID=UPI001C73B1A4|nr:recombinase family protein [Halobacillus sp. Nhm2S1]MBX0357682.1 recombinase family protein [Halobacillus sp. Nhm2S1]
MMKNVFCYYRKSINFGNSWTPVERIIYQDKMLFDYCSSNNINVLKRFSDLGYLGAPFQRPELLQIRKIIEKPNNRADLLLFYSIAGLRTEMKSNAELLLEVVEVLGDVHFFREGLKLDYMRFEMYLKGAINIDLPGYEETTAPMLGKREEA